MAFERLARARDVGPNSTTEVLVNGEPVALCRVGDEWFALNGLCPHRGGPLGQGAMEGENVLCPWHAWAFNVHNGANDFDPNCRVATYPVRIEGEDVWVDLA